MRAESIPTERQLLAQMVLRNDAAIRQFSKLLVDLVERAVDLGAYDENANLIRHHAEQLLADLEVHAEQSKALMVLFELPEGIENRPPLANSD